MAAAGPRRVGKPSAFRATTDIIDIDLKKRVARVSCVGETIHVIETVKKACQVMVPGGRYACDEPKVFFIRYGAPEATHVSFYDQPQDIE
jgi:hypothetical protein